MKKAFEKKNKNIKKFINATTLKDSTHSLAHAAVLSLFGYNHAIPAIYNYILCLGWLYFEH